MTALLMVILGTELAYAQNPKSNGSSPKQLVILRY